MTTAGRERGRPDGVAREKFSRSWPFRQASDYFGGLIVLPVVGLLWLLTKVLGVAWHWIPVAIERLSDRIRSLYRAGAHAIECLN